MTAEDTDILTGTDYRVTWKAVKSTRFDSAAFKTTHAELYQQYSKQTESRRFVVA
jgi:predicted phage-related endonuclease